MALCLCASLSALPSWASEPKGLGEEHGVQGEAEPHNLVAVRGIGVMALVEEERVFLAGPSVAFERALVPHVLEVELSAALLFGEHAVVPVDLILKAPIHLSEVVQGYIGAGPLVVIPLGEVEGEEGGLHFGGIGSVGSYFWLWGDSGLMAELDVALVSEAVLVTEIEVALGAVFRF